ncbi:hypothetical protein AURDEDRAFT_116292 [Auricularia subglabra TFB-10046 SS5]|uniref:Uncharacterized protein n=1 Tax=Auricularia subglabra (strain TFB-10046 / SS5) TaxID=717982 RepID=J0WX80_AURST|nr:hypothetical protein AURDEDRAFT_116292 [Auricularia subglabra TFB-10046 SS5]
MDSTAAPAAAAQSSRRPALPQLNMNVMRLFTTARRPLRARNTEPTASPIRTKKSAAASVTASPVRTRQSSISAGTSPVRIKVSSPATSPKKSKAKKSKRAPVQEDELTRKYGRTFVSEVALLQFMDGGSLEHNVQRVLKKRAKLAAKQSQLAGREAGVVADHQGLFVDAQEREEHQRLLPRCDEGISEWEEL